MKNIRVDHPSRAFCESVGPEPRVAHVSRSLRNVGLKRSGHISELAFMHKAAALGFGVTKPYGEIEPYDFILDSGCRLWRVQVKSTATPIKHKHSYYVQPAHCNGAYGRSIYTPAEIDFLVAYVVPRDAWYVIPVGALASAINIYLYPDTPHSRGRFERFRDAWCLMACPRHGPPRPEITLPRRCSSPDHCPLTIDTDH